MAGGYREHELQVVLQVCPAGEHYARWRKDRDRLLGRSSKRWGYLQLAAASEPEGRRDRAVALPGGQRVGTALAAAKIVYEPLFIHGCAESRLAVELLAMQAVRLWLHETPDEDTLVLAPPVLEESSARGCSDARCWTAARRPGRCRHPTACRRARRGDSCHRGRQ